MSQPLQEFRSLGVLVHICQLLYMPNMCSKAKTFKSMVIWIPGVSTCMPALYIFRYRPLCTWYLFSLCTAVLQQSDACHHQGTMPSQVVRTPAIFMEVVWVKRCKQQYPPKPALRIISLCALWSMIPGIVGGLWTSSPSSTRACWNLVDLGDSKTPPPHWPSILGWGISRFAGTI